jgi:membrane protease YdiL (CAAX protease family)
LDSLAQQFAATGEDMLATLPPGFTPQMMLWLFVIGGFTVFNIMPGIISGFGEEFGHRGFMFPLLFPNKPFLGLVIGGLLWYAWHLPLALIFPVAAPVPLWQATLSHITAMIGSIGTHTYLCYVYAKSGSIFVPSIAHIAMNNASRSLAYFVVITDQFTTNIAQYLVMVIVIAVLCYRKELKIIPEFLSQRNS